MLATVMPAVFTSEILYAVRALSEGKATAGQQLAAYAWIMQKACALPDISFSLGGEDGRRRTDFHQGRQFPARQIAHLLEPEAIAEAIEMEKASAKR